MIHIQKPIAVLLLLLSLSGCAGSDARLPEPNENALSVTALFQAENGDALQGGAAQFSIGETDGSYLLDGSGEVSVSGLPRNGELLLTLFDQQQRLQGAMTLSFSEGAVIDATTGEDGVGHITVRNDIDSVSLVFILAEDGGLQCALWLANAVPLPEDGSQKGI